MFTKVNRFFTYCGDDVRVKGQTEMSGVTPGDFSDLVKAATSLGATALVLSVLAWKSPQLVRELFAGIRGLINDFRKPRTKPRTKLKT